MNLWRAGEEVKKRKGEEVEGDTGRKDEGVAGVEVDKGWREKRESKMEGERVGDLQIDVRYDLCKSAQTHTLLVSHLRNENAYELFKLL